MSSPLSTHASHHRLHKHTHVLMSSSLTPRDPHHVFIFFSPHTCPALHLPRVIHFTKVVFIVDDSLSLFSNSSIVNSATFLFHEATRRLAARGVINRVGVARTSRFFLCLCICLSCPLCLFTQISSELSHQVRWFRSYIVCLFIFTAAEL